MAIEYGFFNSLNDDRLYNADTFNTYFQGLIRDSGVYDTLPGKLTVSATYPNSMNVEIDVGKALVKGHWIKLTAPEVVEIDEANVYLARIDRIVLRCDETLRTVSIEVLKGTPSSVPKNGRAPLQRTATIYDICLAEVTIPARATVIKTSNILDTRYDDNLCGIISALIKQADIGILYEQYNARFMEMQEAMENWQASEKAAFQEWMESLTEELTVEGYLASYSKTVTGNTASPISFIVLDMTGYTYNENDTIIANLNGFSLVKDKDYTISVNEGVATMLLVPSLKSNDTVNVIVFKSTLGAPPDINGDLVKY